MFHKNGAGGDSRRIGWRDLCLGGRRRQHARRL